MPRPPTPKPNMGEWTPPPHQDSPIGWVANPDNPNNTAGPFTSVDPIVAASQRHDIPLIRAGGPNRAAIAKLGPAQQQKLLRSLGFHVQLDGKNGPQTTAATWAYMHGHNAGWFNNQGADWQQALWNKLNTAPVRPTATARTKPTHPNNSTPVQPSDAQTSDSSPMNTLIGKVLGDAGALSSGANIGTLLDRAKAGAAAAELGYGSTIRDLEKSIHADPLESASHQAEITSWYKKLRDQIASGGADTAKTADALISSQQGAGDAIAQSFGGAANPSMGELSAAGDSEVGNLRALKLIAATGNEGASSAAGAAGLSARTRQLLADQAQLTSDKGKLADATAASGATYDTAANAADAANAGVQQQRFQNVTAAAQARIAALASGATLAIKQQSADAATSRAAAYAKKTAAVAKLPKGSWSATSAADKGKVADAALSAAQAMAAAGHSTAEIRKQIAALYASRGWSLSNPAVQRAMGAVLAGVPPKKK